jgi:hypothetical protein
VFANIMQVGTFILYTIMRGELICVLCAQNAKKMDFEA